MAGLATFRLHLVPLRAILCMLLYVMLSQTHASTETPVIHWRFEGNGEDSMGNENIHKLIKPSFSEDCIEGTQALSIDNSIRNGALISLAKSEVPTFTQKSFEERTFSLWFKAQISETYPDTEQCLFKVGNLSRGIILYLSGENIHAKVFVTKKGERTVKEITAPYKTNQWTHVALRFDKGKFTLFVDSKESSEVLLTNATEINLARTGASLGCLVGSKSAIKKHAPNINAFNGLIDEVKIFDQALHEKKIQALYEEHSAVAKENKSPANANPKEPQQDTKLASKKSPSKKKKKKKRKAKLAKQYETTLKVYINPIVHWRFEDNGFDENEIHHLDTFYKTTYSDDAIEGEKCLSFDRSQKSCVLIAPMDIESGHFTQKAFTEKTISFCFKPKTSDLETNQKQCLMKTGDLEGGLFIYLQDNKLYTNIVNLTSKGKGVLIRKLQSFYQLNEWNHLALIFSKGNVIMYVNNQMADQTMFPKTARFNGTTGGTSLGAVHARTISQKDNPHTHPYHGLIDNVQIFDQSLGESAIQRLSENKSILKEETLTLEGTMPLETASTNLSTVSNTTSANLTQGKRYYIGVGIFVLGIIGIFMGLILVFKKSLNTYDQYDSQIKKIG